MKRKDPPPWLLASRLRTWQPAEGERTDWLTRALGRAGIMTRAEAEQAIAAGRVQLDGQVVLEPLTPVRPGAEARVDGVPVSLEAPTLALMLHKPAGLVTSKSDPEGIGTVYGHLYSVLPPELRRYEWLAVGRLDRDTTGLLLFTNDERLSGHVTLPDTHLPKRYVAQVAARPTEDHLEPIRRGITLRDGPCRPAPARVVGSNRVELILTEGRRHQVKRMLKAVRLPVQQLHREAVGSVTLDIPLGSWRLLTDQEIAQGLGFPPAGTRSTP